METAEDCALVYESSYWKNELLVLASEIARLQSRPIPEEGDCGEDLEFRLERALLYSAFVIRILFESNKLTDKMSGMSVPLVLFPSLVDDWDKVSPVSKRFPDSKYFDWDNSSKTTMNVRSFSNQLIHGATIITFEFDGRDVPLGFLVTSDRGLNRGLFRCLFSDWLQVVRMIAADEVISYQVVFDRDKGKWTSHRS